MTALAAFGINSDSLDTAVKMVTFSIVVIWVALVYYTYTDARRRIADPMLVGCATLASLFPIVGTIVYVIVRPPEYLDDVRERELEMAAAEARLHHLGYHLCPHCDYEVEREFLRCPACMRKLRDSCGSCGRPLEPTWRICPYCEAEIPGVTPQPRRRRAARPLPDSTPAGVAGDAPGRPTASKAPPRS
jgi:hypothetical protein